MKKMIYLSIILSIFSCKRNDEDFRFGPETIIVEKDFEVSGFSVSTDNVDLSTTDVFVNCTTNRRVEWKIVYRGLSSNATKEVVGISQDISQANSTWTGDSDNLYLFRTGENCEVELSFRGATKTYKDTIAISKENLYPNSKVITNYEAVNIGFQLPSYGNTGSIGLYGDATDIPSSDFRTITDADAIQGNKVLSLTGVDVGGSGFYIGGTYNQGVYSIPAGVDLYFNFYVKGNSAKPTFVSVAIEETDGDKFEYRDILVNTDTWKLVSLQYTSFIHTSGALGNKTFEPEKVKAFNMNMNSSVAGGNAQATLDYLVVSYNQPFEP